MEILVAIGRAIYARLSQDLGKLSENVNIQIEIGREYFADQGWPVDENLIFSDNDLSASKFSDKPRPGYHDLLAAIRAGRVRVLVVTEISRLCRNLADAIEIIGLAKETPFTTIEVVGGPRYELTTVQGEHDFLGAVLDASRESGRTSDRVRRKKRVRAREGKFNGGGRPYGYVKPEDGDNGELAIVEAEAAVIRELTTRLLAGESLRSLVMELNGREVPTATDKRWHPATVRRLQVVMSAAARQFRPSHTGGRSYLLTGLIECACGAKLIASANAGTREPIPKRRYRCRTLDPGGGPRGCGKLTRLADPVDLAVAEAVFARYSSDGLAVLLAPDAPVELHELAATLGEDRERLQQAGRDRYRRKGDPLRLEEGQFLAIQAEIKEAMEMTRRRMARLEQGRALAEIPPGMTLRQAWDAADLGWRRTILSLVVVKVILSPGYPGRRVWPAADSPLLERAKSMGGPWCFDPSKIDIKWKL